jgi:hypothetical protein
MHNAHLYRSGKTPKTTKKVRIKVSRARTATNSKLNKAAIMAKIEANIRRKVKAYLTKQKGRMKTSTYNHRIRGRRRAVKSTRKTRT